jgi:hypothetical protein
MLQQKFTVQVTTLPDCDDITRFDGTSMIVIFISNGWLLDISYLKVYNIRYKVCYRYRISRGFQQAFIFISHRSNPTRLPDPDPWLQKFQTNADQWGSGILVKFSHEKYTGT